MTHPLTLTGSFLVRMSGDQAGHDVARVVLPRESFANAGHFFHAPSGIPNPRASHEARFEPDFEPLYYAAVSDDGQAEESSIYSVACPTVRPTQPTHVST